VNWRLVLRAVSALLIVIGVAMATAIPVAWHMGDSSGVIHGLVGCVGVTLAVAAAGLLATRGAGHFKLREGFAIVTLGWIAASIFGALPFAVISHLHWYDAFFETMSGFTTTGASVLDNTLRLANGETLHSGIADLPYGVLYWRSMTHWLGGMGIVVLSLAILPSLGLGAQLLYRAEVPGPLDDQLTPRIADSAKILWGVYVLLSVAETVLLRVGGMPLFDAWCHTCGTMATGGFSTQQSSVGSYDSVYIDVVIALFMFLAGANFVLHFRALRGKPITYVRDEEFRFYCLVTVAATLMVTVGLLGRDIVSTCGTRYEAAGFGTSLRFAFFQVVSILTTTGFCTADSDLWPAGCGMLLICLMFIGGCAGSTGGGMKHSRVLVVLKQVLSELQRCVFPRSVLNIRLNRQRLPGDAVHKVMAFFCLFVGMYVFFTLAISVLGVDDIVTASSASIAALGNIGPGLGRVGATCTYAWMSPSAKMLLSLAMLMGRLELYTVLVLIVPEAYK